MPGKEKRVEELERKIEEPGFWDNAEESQHSKGRALVVDAYPQGLEECCKYNQNYVERAMEIAGRTILTYVNIRRTGSKASLCDNLIPYLN